MIRHGSLLRGMVLGVVGLGLIAPIAFGLAQTLRAAFGLLPALGYVTASLDPWRHLATLPGFATSLRLSITTGLGATVLSVALAMGAYAAFHGRIGAGRKGAAQIGAARTGTGTIGRILTPFLATPHAAMAVGLAFVLAPSGWIARGFAGIMGWQTPPDLASVNDGWGLALIVGLMAKEVPFLLLVIHSAAAQIPVARQMAAGRALGYGRGAVWLKIIAPQIWPLIRLPVWVVLAFALSVVDMAIILGPSNPPTLAVAVTRWAMDPDPAMILPASAGALLQAGVVLVGLGVFWLAERGLRAAGLWWLRRGGRGLRAKVGRRAKVGLRVEAVLWLASAAVIGLMALAGLALAGLVIWSVAWRWPFPQILPASWSLAAWSGQSDGWRAALGHTLGLAATTTAISVSLAILWLEGEDRGSLARAKWAQVLIYLPLLVPQIGFLYGLNVGFLQIGISGGVAAVIWAQTLFVFPYVMIALTDPWRAFDPRLDRVAAALGAGPWRRLIAVKLPVLLRPILTAAAIGVAVSVAQYLPTLFMGAGRIATLTTEAVTLSSGSDRRITAVYASLQAALPFAAYLVAFLVPAALHRNRRDLTGAAPK